MRADVERWNERYAARDERERAEPDAWLAEVARAAPSGCALDVACGVGANVLWLAAHGFDAYGVDCSAEALRRAALAAREAKVELHLFVADLDQWTPPPEHFALVTMFRYLNRTLVPALVASLVPGGCLAWQTFNHNRRRQAPHFNPAYLLAAGELERLTAGLEVLELDDGHGDAPTSRVLARRRP